MVLGPPGVGKTALVREALHQAGDTPGWKENAMVVQLSGLIHTDARVTLKDISRQLDLENVVGDKVFGSYAVACHLKSKQCLCMKSPKHPFPDFRLHI